MNEMAQQSREKWIDNAKGISMLCVILGHVSGGLKGSWNFQFVYGFHLVMFFLLSGYTLKRKPLTVDYVNAKFSRLMIPYFYTCIAVMVMDTWNSYYLNHDDSIATVSGLIGKNLIRGFFASGASTAYGTINVGTRIGAIWFLPAMFFAVVLFQGLLQIMDESLKLGIVTFFLAMSGYLSARVIWFPFSIQAGMVATFFLWIGYEIRKKEYLNKIRWQYYLIAQIIFLLGLHYNYANAGFVVGDFNDIVFSVLVGLAGCVLVYLISIHMEKSRIICWVGRNSILVLCTHLFALETMGAYIAWCANRIGFQGDIYVWSVIILEILVALITAFFIKMILIYGKDVSFQLHSCVGAMKKDEGLNCLAASKKMGGKAGRDTAIDATKGILIILMLIGHFPLDGRLRMIIYSFHMTAFVFLSGYFYKKGQSTVKMLVHVFRIFLIPYVIFVGGVIIKNINNWSISYLTGAVKQYLLGISFSARISWGGGIFSRTSLLYTYVICCKSNLYIGRCICAREGI